MAFKLLFKDPRLLLLDFRDSGISFQNKREQQVVFCYEYGDWRGILKGEKSKLLERNKLCC